MRKARLRSLEHQFSGTLDTNPTLSGVLDDFRVYRRALSPADITALFAVH